MPVVSRPGVLRQGPGAAGESLAEATTRPRSVGRRALRRVDVGRAHGFVPPSDALPTRDATRAPRIGADAVNPVTTSAFALLEHVRRKADPALIAGDERRFAA